MEKYDVIFCVLTYKNHLDLIDLLRSINEKIMVSYKVIIINNFADEDSLQKIRKIAFLNDCDFIESENKGYGHGNNIGILFAKTSYQFKYLVVCNPDTIIKSFNINKLKGSENKITAPDIICLDGRRQNPAFFNYDPLVERMLYLALKKKNYLLFYFGIIKNKIDRILNNFLMRLKGKKLKSIYMCHGSFIIFSNQALFKLDPVFDNKIFLFSEEYDLAKTVKKNGIDIIFNNEIVIIHKEDGSIKKSNIRVRDIHIKSFSYYYNKWRLI